ncbi:MAG: response regulator transcription factor [Deltaproteobacteria bacterium]|nr:response regulator transcription factor [Deltaproteobacteria bacterium]
MATIKLCIISPQSLFRQGVRHSLAGMSGIEIISEAEVNDGALSAVENSLPDVVMVDIDTPSDNGLKLARQIRQRLPNIGVIVITSTPDDEQLFQAIKAQAAAYLSKDITAEELVNTIKRTAKGEHPINESFVSHPKVAEQVLHHFRELPLGQGTESIVSPVTPREQEILNYMAKGYLNKQIALALEISEQTVKNHVTSILRKLNANARTQAVVEAIKHGLVTIT